MSRSSATATRIVPRPSNKKLKKLEKLKKKASNSSAPSSQGSTISTQSEDVVSHEDENSNVTNSIIHEDSIAILNDQPNEATPILCENEPETPKVGENSQFSGDDKTADAESLSNFDDENQKRSDAYVVETEDAEVTTPQEGIVESQDFTEKQNLISSDINDALKQSTIVNDECNNDISRESSNVPDKNRSTDMLNRKSVVPSEIDNFKILADEELNPDTNSPVEQNEFSFIEKKQESMHSLSELDTSHEEVAKTFEYDECSDKGTHSNCLKEAFLEESASKEDESVEDCVQDITIGDKSDIVDLKISDTEKEQAIKIKQDFLDAMDIDTDFSAKMTIIDQTENMNMILDHRKYVLKSVTTEKTTLSTSQLLYSKLNVDFDIAVSILENGHVKFSNISNKHFLNLQYDLIASLNISISQLKSLKVYLKSNYSTNLLNDKVQGEINPSVLIIDTISGTLWDFENIRSSFVSQTPFIRKNDILRKLDYSTEKDISFLRKSGCLLLKTEKQQLVLYNIYKNQIVYLKHNNEKQGKGFFKKMFSYGNSPRDDVIDYVIEDGHNEDTVVVLFKSDISKYHIRKHSDLPDAKYHFDRNEEFHNIEKDGLIYNNILNNRIPITALRLNKVYSNKSASFYSLLVCTSYSEYTLVTMKISDKLEVIGNFELKLLKPESLTYREELRVQTSYIDEQDFYTYFVTYGSEIFFSQIPLYENKKELVFSDVIIFKPKTKVFAGSIYQVEYAEDRSTCLSFQTDIGGQYTFYQLHLKNENQPSSEAAAYSELLNFHLENYVFNNIVDNDQELLNNEVDHKWMSLMKNEFARAFENQVKETLNNTDILPEKKLYIFENVLNNIKQNLLSWTTLTSKEFIKSSVLSILEHLSNIKVLIKMTSTALSAEQSVINAFSEFNQQFMSCDHETLNVDKLLDVVTNVIYKSLLCDIELKYRCDSFEDLLGKSCYDSVLFSSNVNHNLVNFIAMVESLDLDSNEKIFSEFLNLLRVLYYQNAFGVNKIDTLVVSIGNVLNIFKGKLELHEINLLKGLTAINRDWVSTFKIYDYLSANQKVQYSEYQNLFELEEEKEVLVKCFLDLYLNKDYKTKLQNFFDIMSGVDSPAFIKDVYKELASRERTGNVPEVLWAFETLINKDYKKAFKALSEIENNNVNFSESKAKSQDYEGFKECMMRLCEVLSANDKS